LIAPFSVSSGLIESAEVLAEQNRTIPIDRKSLEAATAAAQFQNQTRTVLELLQNGA
jgi:hypothetical protein